MMELVLKCHRFVLAACSPFFEKAFENYAKQKSCSGVKDIIVLLATYTSKNVQRMVDYIYYGKLPDTDKDIDDDLIRLANELKIIGFKELLLEKQRADINLNNDVLSENETSHMICAGNVESNEIVIIPNKDNISSSEASDLCSSFPLTNFNAKREPEYVPPLSTSEELFKSSPEYENWMRRLSNKTPNRSLCWYPQELLSDIIEGVKYSYSYNPKGEPECRTKIEGQCFIGSGSSKLGARLNAVKTILRSIFNISFDSPRIIQTFSPANLPVELFEDKVERLILDKYAGLVRKIDNYYSGYKVIAGIVQSVDYDLNSLKVVSIGTGSKFLYEKHLDSKGNAVHDTHAEVVARRGFIRYIYNEINQCIGNSKSVFEKSDKNNRNFQLKSDVKFHLYISSAPCGDARVYSHGNDSVSSAIPEGKLRTKGQSALTVTKDTTYNDICNVNMSCSAKMLKWNILGIQGALLCRVIDSIYLSSIILGEKFDEKHMERALYGRIQTLLTKLPKGYHINRPKLMKVSATKVKTALYSPNHSINWNGKSEDVEILESTSGRTLGKDKTKEYSRISRRAFFTEFNRIANKLKHSHVRYIYYEAKLSAMDYQIAKSILFQILENNGLGTWIQKNGLNNFRI